ncbi:Cytochrome P450 [Mycena venus]|uniref:Cytochrome P450 n=1 Tax=Mycena venus TaxID=2733690 RepID=A0A8H6Y176_9AGAR|nr:Cytochrome P450 [Mycena venus]
MLSLDHPTTTGAACLGLGLVLYGLFSRRNRSSLPLPPGPKKLPLVGNVFDIPASHPWETYMAWSKEYDTDIIHLNLAGTSVIVLSSLRASEALLEKRSSIYSDRARLPMLMELMGWDFNVAMMKYGDEWRAHRRLFNQRFTAKASLQYRPQQLAATHELLRRFLHAPDDFMAHFRQWASEIIMSVAYGIDVLPSNDPYVSLAYEAVETLSNAGVPGKYLVDSLPILKYVPSWFPGAGFKRDAEEWTKLSQRLADAPLAETKRQMELGIARPSFTADSLNALKDSDGDTYYTESTVRATAGTMYVGGADTTVSALGSFILGMLANPAAQRKAQAEIDSVTKGRYLPDFADEAAMPYVAAVVKETLRWKNVGPIAIPHFITVEDEYQGYRIPANSIVIGNTWAILHDETVYPEPYTFRPERFLLDDGSPNPAVPDPEVAFGYGRRLCPGRHMASASLWITVSSVLAAFDITKAVDEDGREIEPSYEFDSGFINAPLPFKCSIRPRSKEAVSLIQATGHDEGRA